MKPKIKKLLALTLLAGSFISSGWAQTSKEMALFASQKWEEKKSELELYNLQAARRIIAQQYRKMEIAQQNVDIQMLLSVTHPDYKAYAHGGDVWDIKKLEMYWAGGLKQVVSTEVLDNNFKSFIMILCIQLF